MVEGQTEEVFVRDVLAPYLHPYNVISTPHCLNGLSRYQKLRNHLALWMKEDHGPEARFTTMVDLYRLPQDFPGRGRQRQPDPILHVQGLEREFARDIDDDRFIPYLQLHEFEALLFSKPAKFALPYPHSGKQIGQLDAIRSHFPSPEHIDDGEQTAPSKRIQQVLPEYEKVAAGPLIAQEIGIKTLMERCAHFAAWVEQLRNLGG